MPMLPKVWATFNEGPIVTRIEAGAIDAVITLRGGRTSVHVAGMLLQTARGARPRATHRVFGSPMFLGIRHRRIREAGMGVVGVGPKIADGMHQRLGWLEEEVLTGMMGLLGLIPANGRRNR